VTNDNEPTPIGRTLFVHGMYMTPACWTPWVERFRVAGIDAEALAWPGRDRPIRDLQADTDDPTLAALGLSDVVTSVEAVVRAEPLPPVLIGHSMGGLAAQLVMSRAPVSAVVVVSSAAPRGVLSTKWPFLRANWGHITPFRSKRHPVVMSFERFQYTFVNGMPLDEQRAAFDTLVVPESRRVPAGALTAAAKVDFAAPHPPLLFVAGGNDHLIPASLNRANAKRYRRSPSRTDVQEFKGRNHFILGQQGWEEVADSILAWLREPQPETSGGA